MKAPQLLLLAASTSLPSSVVAFTLPTHRASTARAGAAPPCRPVGARQRMTAHGGDEGAAPAPRTRRKRKDGQQFSPPSSDQPESDRDGAAAATATAAAPKPVENVVTLPVRDIRDVVSGAPAAATADAPADAPADAGAADDDAELADDEEWEYYDVDADGNEIAAVQERGAGGAPNGGALERLNEILAVDGRDAGRARDESLERLLEDARGMRSSSPAPIVEETPVRDAIFKAISTIVTVDFFVVIGLLLWFLAGIFCSTVLGSDTVQIAFNMNFERVTQPALGILMIGSVAGSFGNKDEEE